MKPSEQFPVGKHVEFKRSCDPNVRTGQVESVDDEKGTVYVRENGPDPDVVVIHPGKDYINGKYDIYSPYSEYDTPEERKLCQEMNMYIAFYMLYDNDDYTDADNSLYNNMAENNHGRMDYKGVHALNRGWVLDILQYSGISENDIIADIPEAKGILYEMHADGTLPLKKIEKKEVMHQCH